MASPCTTNLTSWTPISTPAKVMSSIIVELKTAINRERVRRSKTQYSVTDPQLSVITRDQFVELFNMLENTRNVIDSDIDFPAVTEKLTPDNIASIRSKINTVEYECICNCNYINAGYTCTCNYYKKTCACTYTLGGCSCNTRWYCTSYSANYYCGTNVTPPTEI